MSFLPAAFMGTAALVNATHPAGTPRLLAVDPNGNMQAVQDDLYFIHVKGSGTDTLTNAVVTFTKWLFIVGGPGTVAAMP